MFGAIFVYIYNDTDDKKPDIQPPSVECPVKFIGQIRNRSENTLLRYILCF